jgi:hypothetical protein
MRQGAGSGKDPLDGMTLGALDSSTSHGHRGRGRGYGCVCFAGRHRRKGRAQIRDRRVGRLGPVPGSQGWETCEEGLTHFSVEDGYPRQPGIAPGIRMVAQQPWRWSSLSHPMVLGQPTGPIIIVIIYLLGNPIQIGEGGDASQLAWPVATDASVSYGRRAPIERLVPLGSSHGALPDQFPLR